MAAQVSHTDYIPLPNGSNDQVPSCSHGPALMFERFDKRHKTLRQFYACSAFRDRKACDFFKWADESLSDSNAVSDNLLDKPKSHKDLRKRFRAFKRLPQHERSVCCSCGLLLLPAEVEHHESKGHILKNNVGLNCLRRASSLFIPLDNNKTFAQYLFSKSTVNFLIETLSHLSLTHVLCIGVPRIHEEIQFMKRKGNNTLKSFLLDLDDRYAQVYPPSAFTKYNMFNHHFFDVEGRTSVCKFLADGGNSVILLTDPPFGGMVEPLAKSLIEMSHLTDQDGVEIGRKKAKDPKECRLPLIWFFPYFMETRILNCLSIIAMLDYKVEYDNHCLYKNNVKKKGSPVRMFTNISAARFNLPPEERYWFCDICQRHSSSENWHCQDCGSCTSKDGSRYIHCDICCRCVKPSRIHCFKCNSCQTQDHVCGKVFSEGCYICGELGHKRRDCPQKYSAKSTGNPIMKQSVKRSSDSSSAHAKKRKKKK